MVCHGANAVTLNTAFKLFVKYKTLPEMTKFINDNMPLGNAKACINECAENTAYYILSVYNSGAIINPPTIPTVTPNPIVTPTPIITPRPSSAPVASPTATPNIIPTPMPTILPQPISTPISSVTPKPSITPLPSITPSPTLTPAPTPPNTIPYSYSPLRRLTHDEYANTIKSLLGISVDLNSFPTERITNGYVQSSEQVTDTPYLEAFLNTANTITTQLDLKVETFTGCTSTSINFKTCLNTFFKNFGLKVYRRPLSTTEITELQSLYDLIASRSRGDTAIKYTIMTMLTSSNFIYIVEDGTYFLNSTIKPINSLNIGQPSNIKIIKLDSYEVATRLSYLILDNTPDTALLSAAAKDELLNPENVLQHFDRLMQLNSTNQTRSGILKQLENWMGVESVEIIAKNISVSINEAKIARDQTSTFLKDWFFQNKELSSLFNGSVNVSLSQDSTGVDPSQNVGILGLQGFLASHTHANVPAPITRGVFTIENLLCQNLPSPPANIGEPPARPINGTTRDWLALHRSDPSCAGCHNLIDPYGIVYEEFDDKGQMRKFDNGNAVDASIELPSIGDIYGAVQGINNFANLFASSNVAQECAAEFWYQNTLGREKNSKDEDYLNFINQQWKKSGGSAKNLLREIVKSPMFYVRIID